MLEGMDGQQLKHLETMFHEPPYHDSGIGCTQLHIRSKQGSRKVLKSGHLMKQ